MFAIILWVLLSILFAIGWSNWQGLMKEFDAA